MSLSARCPCTPFIEKTEQHWQAMEPSHKNVSYVSLVVWKTNDHHIKCCRMLSPCLNQRLFGRPAQTHSLNIFLSLRQSCHALSIKLAINCLVCCLLLYRTMFQQPFPIKTLVWRQSWMRLAMLFCCLSVILVRTWLSSLIMNIVHIVPQESAFLPNNNMNSE